MLHVSFPTIDWCDAPYSETVALRVTTQLNNFSSSTVLIVNAYHYCKHSKENSKKSGPKDRSYVNKSENHEVNYESKRKTKAKKFGSKKK
jgi:hypothetical protein